MKAIASGDTGHVTTTLGKCGRATGNGHEDDLRNFSKTHGEDLGGPASIGPDAAYIGLRQFAGR
jgi:hypothetical protein